MREGQLEWSKKGRVMGEQLEELGRVPSDRALTGMDPIRQSLEIHGEAAEFHFGRDQSAL